MISCIKCKDSFVMVWLSPDGVIIHVHVMQWADQCPPPGVGKLDVVRPWVGRRVGGAPAVVVWWPGDAVIVGFN